MEIFGITILTVFAFLGAMLTVSWLYRRTKSKYFDAGIKLILYLPQNCTSNLEGVIRRIFSEEIPERLMTDGKVYMDASKADAETRGLIGSLQTMYPIEVLPDPKGYCIITEETKSV
ncbi:MAG: hypothetical protein N2376_11280 [Clostridia bacterium]|nr:hypothetical protein [Clostridia bacterium]